MKQKLCACLPNGLALGYPLFGMVWLMLATS